ncbi:MAG: hypothetical protein methR_P3896 [Methyloprofundus sp.]|nr:MAG: hypothetical protein methR_P3896 [Methyloprofundus sp.]
MAKSASPIRLQAELMQVAESTAKRFHRSTAEQIEYWADLGRKVASHIDPDVLLSVASGLTMIKAEPVYHKPIDPKIIFQSLENDRKAGELSNQVSNSVIRYQTSTKHLGYLERIDKNDNITTGQFQQGEFIELKE